MGITIKKTTGLTGKKKERAYVKTQATTQQGDMNMMLMFCWICTTNIIGNRNNEIAIATYIHTAVHKYAHRRHS